MGKNKKEVHVLDQIMQSATDKSGQFNMRQAGKEYQKFLQGVQDDYDKLGKAEQAKVGGFHNYLNQSFDNASQKALDRMGDFLKAEGKAWGNVNATIIRYEDRIKRIGDPQSLSKKELKSFFSQKQQEIFKQQAAVSTELKLGMRDKLTYTKRKFQDKVGDLMDRFRGGEGGHHSAEDFLLEQKGSRRFMGEINQKRYELMRQELSKQKGDLRKDVKQLKKVSSAISNFDYDAIEATQSQRGVKNIIKSSRNERAALAAEKAGKGGGWGWKGKAGAVVGLLALGGIIGNQFAGGKKSNAELYNPNPQPQYYS